MALNVTIETEKQALDSLDREVRAGGYTRSRLALFVYTNDRKPFILL